MLLTPLYWIGCVFPPAGLFPHERIFCPGMCGRFARRSTQQVLADWFGVELEEMPWFAPSYNAAPQSVQPVVRLNRDSGKPEFVLNRWGLVPFWAKDAKPAYATINARAEEAATKPAFREALKKRRCLVPADAFYEWQRPTQNWTRRQSSPLPSPSSPASLMLLPASGSAGSPKKARRLRPSPSSPPIPMS